MCGCNPPGALRGRCFNVDTGEVNPDDFCSIGNVDWENLDYYWVKKDMVVTGGSHVGGAFLCPRMEEDCLQLGENPGRETVSFDDIGVAIMTIFQVMTLEGWADLCYQIQDTVGYWNWLYFVLLIMIGPMFCLFTQVSVCNGKTIQRVENEGVEIEGFDFCIFMFWFIFLNTYDCSCVPFCLFLGTKREHMNNHKYSER